MKKILPLLLLLLASLSLCAQTIYYVKPTGNDANSGTSWATAFKTLQKALLTASSGEIWVAAGTYYPDRIGSTNNDDRTATFNLKSNLALYGGFAGTETDRSQRNWKAHVTILTGDIDGNNAYTGNSYHVLQANWIVNAVLDGFTVTWGIADGNPDDADGNGRGGGLHNLNSTVTVANCRFLKNDATRGGAINNWASTLMVINTSFIQNQGAAGWGGAIYNESYWGSLSGREAQVSATNCTFYGNSARYGGALENWNSSKATLANCILWGNSCEEGQNCQIHGEASVSYSIVQGDWNGDGNLNLDPLFVNADAGNVHVQCNSPAVDAGNNAALPGTVISDGDGQRRVGNGRVDIGAYEIPGVLYVKANATGTGDGSSWADAFPKLQDALPKTMCNLPIQIWVAKGTYYPDEGAGLTNNDRTLSFVLQNNVAIYGGFDGTEAMFFMRNPGLNETILSGDIDGLAGNGGNAYHVVTATAVDGTAVLDGFTLSDGNANATNNNYGGGMYNTSAAPTVANCTFKNNAAAAGGALFNLAASPTLTHCSFLNNRANSGGGIYNRSTIPASSNSSPVINGCSFLSNIVTGQGGALYNDGSSGTVVNCVFWSNGAATGAGLFNQYTNDLRIINCSFASNSASSAGGAFYNRNNYTSQPTITNAILWGDTPGEIAGDGATVTYSIVQDSYYPDAGNLTEDPLFVKVASGDLHLQPCSPAIDAGHDAAVPSGITSDFDGASRTAMTQTDMGAYEFPGAIYVKKDATGLNDGTSWTNAYTSLQNALAQPAGCSHQRMIWVAKGTYYPDEGAGQTNNNRSASFHLKNNMAILGGFAGTEISLSQRTPFTAQNYRTILSGEIDGVTGNAGNAYHVVRSEGVDSSAVLDGFTITGGNANGSTTPDNVGGGLYNTSTPTLRYCTFNANSATHGGALYNTAAASIINCIFTQNRASYGGAVYNAAASPGIHNGLFWKNTATSQGGAIYNTAASPRIINGSFNSNSASSGYGGALRNVAASAPTITNSILWGDGGGEISDAGSTPVISYSIVQDINTGENNLTADPLFRDATTGDLSLKDYPIPSPAIDAGNNAVVTLATDVYGGQRIYNNIVDMGADEYYPSSKGGPEPLVLTCPQDFTLQSDPGSCGAVADYSGAHAATTTGGEPPITLTYDPAPGTGLPLGEVWVTVTAKDAYRTLHCSFWITVVDTVPPVITDVTVDRPVLYPPNHQLQDITVAYSIHDSCATTALSVTSNEPQYGSGSGNTGPDWQVIDNHHLKLRAERSGKGTDRIYTITITAKDAAGNESQATTTVTVRHDNRTPVTAAEAAAGKEVASLSINAIPNPSSDGFTLQVQSLSNLPLGIKVIDPIGKVIDRKEGVAPNGTFYLGSTYRPGVYYLQVQQGSARQTLKLVKQTH